MQEKLRRIEQRYQQLELQLNDPGTYGDHERLLQLQRQQKELQPIVEAYRAYEQTLRDENTAREMIADPGLRELGQEELFSALEREKTLEAQLKILLLPKDPDDEKSIVLEIRAGTGGEEGALFAGDLARMYQMYAQKKGFSFIPVNANETELGGIKELTATIEGVGVWSCFKFEAGTHCVKRVPETESAGRIHTSTATVAVLPQVQETEFAIHPKDLQIDTYRSSGAGGQHVNKTESAIRITHLPTGTVVECQDERSQYKNKDRAMSILRSRLYEAEKAKHDADYAAMRRGQIGMAERSERIRTYRFQEKIVVDHRLVGDSRCFPVLAVLNGDLDGIVEALTLQQQAELLQQNDQNKEDN